MMNSDFSSAAASQSQGTTQGRMGDASEPSCPSFEPGVQTFQQESAFSGFGFDAPAFQQENNASAMQFSFELEPGPEVSAAKGFRARWRAKSQAKRDDMSMFGGESSGSQVPSQSTGSAPCLIPSAKRQKTQDEVARESNSESNDVSTIQLQNVARLASLEAMHRFRTHDIKMPWEQGPLAPVFGGPMPAMPPVKSLVPPEVGLIDTLAPAASKCVVPEDEMLARCLNQIKSLLLLDLQGTEVGVTLCNLAGGLDDSIDVLQILKDCFAKKATATILKRTSSLWSLAGWMLENEQTQVWSITEQQLYSYMCTLRDQHAIKFHELLGFCDF